MTRDQTATVYRALLMLYEEVHHPGAACSQGRDLEAETAEARGILTEAVNNTIDETEDYRPGRFAKDTDVEEG